jgi:hypothetical protein
MSADLRASLRDPTWLLVVVFVLVGATFLPVQFPDTVSYLEHSLARAPGYPLLLDLARLLAGTHWPRAIVLLQGAVAGWSVRQFVLALRERFAAPSGLALFLGLVVALPQLVWVPDLLTESLSHSLFLVVLAALLHATLANPLRHFSVAALALTLAIAVRPHFVFIGPVLLVPALVLGWQRRAGRLTLQLSGLMLAAMLAGNFAQIIGNWAYNDLPVRSAALGVHAAAVQLYLATPDELAILQEPEERALVEPLGRFMQQAHLFGGSAPGLTDTVEGFNLAFDQIIYAGMVPQARVRLGHANLTAQDWLALDKATTHIAVRLARHHPAVAIHHVARQLFVGGAMLVLTVASALLGAWLTLRRKDDCGLILATVALLSLANHVELALVQVTRMRYVMTTDLALIVILFALVGQAVLRPDPQRSRVAA